jgi:hypothetical protein
VFGRRWWSPFLLLASTVALILLLALDAYTAFGVTLGVVSVAAIATVLIRTEQSPTPQRLPV